MLRLKCKRLLEERNDLSVLVGQLVTRDIKQTAKANDREQKYDDIMGRLVKRNTELEAEIDRLQAAIDTLGVKLEQWQQVVKTVRKVKQTCSNCGHGWQEEGHWWCGVSGPDRMTYPTNHCSAWEDDCINECNS